MTRRTILLSALFTFAFGTASPGQLFEADRAYQERAAGLDAGRPGSANIEAAIAAYQRAILQSPNELEPRWKLLRALRYKGSYIAKTKEEKRIVFEQAKTIGAQSVTILDRMLAAKGTGPVGKASDRKVADAARQIRGAGQLLYWDAVAWGEWAQVYGKLAAVKQGVADRIRRESTIVMLIDPKIEGGGGARVLGRLHSLTPRVPFLTGWASDSEAVRYLSESFAQDPANKITKVFLAEAMVGADKASRPKAIRILREVIELPDDPAYATEEAGAKQDAKALLARISHSSSP